MNSVQELMAEWDIFDGAINFHGFCEYNRDYRLNASFFAADRVERPVEYCFRGCMEVQYASVVWQPLDDDRFIDYQRWKDAGSPDGFVWGVNFADAYPGWKYIEESPRAKSWYEKTHKLMHEVKIETNVFVLSLVFHELTVKALDPIAPRLDIAR